MKLFVLSVLLIAVLSFIAGLYFPWWSIAVVAFLVALFMPQPTVVNFLAGFVGVFMLWSLLALWIDVQNNSILSQKIALLFHLGGSSALLMVVSALVGGVVGGCAAMTGSLLRPRKKEKHTKRQVSLSNKWG